MSGVACWNQSRDVYVGEISLKNDGAGAENSWARNQLASHNERLLRLLLFSGARYRGSTGAGGQWQRKKVAKRSSRDGAARLAIMLPLSPDNIKCPLDPCCLLCNLA